MTIIFFFVIGPFSLTGRLIDVNEAMIKCYEEPEMVYTVLEKEFANRYEAIVWICKNQLGRRNLTPEQRKYLIGKQYEAEKQSNGGDRKSSAKKSVGQNDQLIGKKHTRLRIADENNVNESFVRRAESFANGVDAAEEAVSGIRAKILSGEVKPTAAELAAVSRAAPEERPALVAKLCKPKDEKRAGRKEKKAIVRAKAEKLETEASEPCEPAELPSAPSPELAPQPVKIDNQQLLEIAASRYHAKRRATGSDMLCEIEAAADNLKQRWEQAFQYYPDLLIDRDNRSAVAMIAQSLTNYLNEVEERTL